MSYRIYANTDSTTSWTAGDLITYRSTYDTDGEYYVYEGGVEHLELRRVKVRGKRISVERRSLLIPAEQRSEYVRVLGFKIGKRKA